MLLPSDLQTRPRNSRICRSSRKYRGESAFHEADSFPNSRNCRKREHMHQTVLFRKFRIRALRKMVSPQHGSFCCTARRRCRSMPDAVRTAFGPFPPTPWKTLSISHMSKLRFRSKIFPDLTNPDIKRLVTSSCSSSTGGWSGSSGYSEKITILPYIARAWLVFFPP